MERIKRFVGHDVWLKGAEDFSSRKGWWLTRQLRLILYTARGVRNHNTVVRSAALTFFTLMSLVPMLALAFGIIKGFGMETTVENYLFDRYPERDEMLRYIFDFVDGVLVRTRGGLVAVGGLVLLVWAAVRVFGNVENAFNAIWEAQTRSVRRRWSTYTAVIFVMPLMAVILTVLLSSVRTLISHYAVIPYNILYAVGSFLLVWLILAGAYKIIPNTKVHFRNAAMAGAVATVAFFVFQLLYAALQDGVSSYNIIYGSFAAVPLFLLWVQTSWQIVLFGAELSFAYQNVDSFVQEQDVANVGTAERRKVMLAALLIVVRTFRQRSGGVSSEEISRELHLPVRLVRDTMHVLKRADIVTTVEPDTDMKTNRYVPARDMSDVRVCDVLRTVENMGSERGLPDGNGYLCTVSEILSGMDAMLERSGGNVLLMDLVDGYESGGDRQR